MNEIQYGKYIQHKQMVDAQGKQLDDQLMQFYGDVDKSYMLIKAKRDGIITEEERLLLREYYKDYGMIK